MWLTLLVVSQIFYVLLYYAFNKRLNSTNVLHFIQAFVICA